MAALAKWRDQHVFLPTPPDPKADAKESKLFSGYGGRAEDPIGSKPESVKVAVRMRHEASHNDVNDTNDAGKHVTAIPESSTVRASDGRKYFFDYVFGPDTSQQLVYETSVQPLLHRFLDGFNCTILAYGQTSSGKTYTMGTDAQDLESATAAHIGILPRLVGDMFATLEARETPLSGGTGRRGSSYRYQLWCQFLEIYNKEIRDLLSERPGRKRGKIELRERGGHVVVVGAKEAPIRDVRGLLDHFSLGCKARTTGATDMNVRSSRSHAIFTLCLTQESAAEDGGVTRLVSKLNLVDLAGSERQKKTNAQGVRLTESKNINMGLLALGNVISALGSQTKAGAHVPYRQSLITRLLQDSLGGNSQTLMLACCSPARRNIEETLNTLKYANRARNIQNAPVRVVTLSHEEIMRLQHELQRMVAQTLSAGSCDGAPEAVISRLDPASLFQAMVLIARHVERAAAGSSAGDARTLERLPSAGGTGAMMQHSGMPVSHPTTDEHSGGEGERNNLRAARAATSSPHARPIDIGPRDKDVGGVFAMENSLIALESEHGKLIECIGAASDAVRVVIDTLADHSRDGRGDAMRRLRGIVNSLEALLGMDDSPNTPLAGDSCSGSERSSVLGADGPTTVAQVRVRAQSGSDDGGAVAAGAFGCLGTRRKSPRSPDAADARRSKRPSRHHGRSAMYTRSIATDTPRQRSATLSDRVVSGFFSLFSSTKTARSGKFVTPAASEALVSDVSPRSDPTAYEFKHLAGVAVAQSHIERPSHNATGSAAEVVARPLPVHPVAEDFRASVEDGYRGATWHAEDALRARRSRASASTGCSRSSIESSAAARSDERRHFSRAAHAVLLPRVSPAPSKDRDARAEPDPGAPRAPQSEASTDAAEAALVNAGPVDPGQGKQEVLVRQVSISLAQRRGDQRSRLERVTSEASGTPPSRELPVSSQGAASRQEGGDSPALGLPKVASAPRATPFTAPQPDTRARASRGVQGPLPVPDAGQFGVRRTPPVHGASSKHATATVQRCTPEASAAPDRSRHWGGMSPAKFQRLRAKFSGKPTKQVAPR